MTLKEDIDKAIEEANFNELEMMGFKTDPKLALVAGVAIGIKLVLANVKKHLEGEEIDEDIS